MCFGACCEHRPSTLAPVSRTLCQPGPASAPATAARLQGGERGTERGDLHAVSPLQRWAEDGLTGTAQVADAAQRAQEPCRQQLAGQLGSQLAPVPQQSRLHLAASPLGDRPLAWAQQDTSAPRSQRGLLSSRLTPEPQAVRYSLAATDTGACRSTMSGSWS